MAKFQGLRGNSEHKQDTGNGITTKRVLRYAMMPEILPRIRALGMHFGHFAYLIALVFRSARLIPEGHPVLNAANIGQFGVRDVIAMAANNITWSKNNIDQIAIFSAIVIGLVLVAIQAVLIAFAALVGFNPASASSMFTPNDSLYIAENDVALTFLAQVFGNDLGLFDEVGAVAQTVPVHSAIRAALGFYSNATMVIAVIIVIYYVMTVIGEAAKTGTPFGQRFNSLWAPIRLVVALGLLVPLGSGLNSAQYITLWMAKMGSGLATNAWILFAREMTETGTLVSRPDTQTTTALVQGIWAAEVCRAGYNQINQSTIVTSPRTGVTRTVPSRTMNIVQNINGIATTVDWNAEEMANRAINAGMTSINLIWTSLPVGSQLTNMAGQGTRSGAGTVYQLGQRCQEFTFNLTDIDVYREGDTVTTTSEPKYFWSDIFGAGQEDKIGTITAELRATYLAEMKSIIDDLRPEAENYAAYNLETRKDPTRYQQPAAIANIETKMDEVARRTYARINGAIASTFADVSTANLSQNEALHHMLARGWGAAGIWFANIGKINQFYQENANLSFPVSDTVAAIGDGNTTFLQRLIGGNSDGVSNVDAEIIELINSAYHDYGQDPFIASAPSDTEPGLYHEIRNTTDSYTESTGGLAYAVMWLFGASELYTLRTDPTLDPMVRLMGAGSGMVDSSIFVGMAAMAATFSDKIPFINKLPRPIINFMKDGLAPVLTVMALFSLTAGVFLFYVIPLMPFIYFALAVMGWVLEIFEAIVAMPLWALAHLRIDGDGMPGGAAIQGYALLLMIFLRPVLIVFGLIGGYLLFGACIFFLSSTFDLAVGAIRQDIDHSNLASTDTATYIGNLIPGMSGPVGALGLLIYTVIYTFLAYNIAVMCFKMVDDVPKGILRWLGVGAQSFGDSRQDPIQGELAVLGAAYGGLTQLQGGMSSARQNMLNRKKDPNYDGSDPPNNNP